MTINILTPDQIDFASYVKETEAKQKVRPATEYVQDLIDSLGKRSQEKRAYLPWRKTHKLFAFRPGEVTLWAGVNGQGKSLVTGMTSASLCTQGERNCIASFEMKPRKTLERMIRQWSGDAPDEEWDHNPDAIAVFRDVYEQFQVWVDGKLWLYDQQGTVAAETAIAVMRYCAKELGIAHFFLDSLMKVVKGEDDYNGQKAFIDEATAIARDYNVHIHIVHHSKKLANEESVPDKMSVKGTGAIVDQVDNLLLLWRNRKKELDAQAGKPVNQEDPDALLICAKQRNGEWEGPIKLWYDKRSQQYLGDPGAQALTLYNWPHES